MLKIVVAENRARMILINIANLSIEPIEFMTSLKIGYHAKAVNNHGFKIIFLILFMLFSAR